MYVCRSATFLGYRVSARVAPDTSAAARDRFIHASTSSSGSKPTNRRLGRSCCCRHDSRFRRSVWLRYDSPQQHKRELSIDSKFKTLTAMCRSVGIDAACAFIWAHWCCRSFVYFEVYTYVHTLHAHPWTDLPCSQRGLHDGGFNTFVPKDGPDTEQHCFSTFRPSRHVWLNVYVAKHPSTQYVGLARS